MNIKDKLKQLAEFLLLNRRSGNTTSLVEVANSKKATILVDNAEVLNYTKQLLDKESESIVLNIENPNFQRDIRGKILGAVLIDNSLVTNLIEDSYREIRRLENKIRMREDFNEYIKEQIRLFEKDPEEFMENKRR